MAIYHFSIKNIGRSNGRSAVAAAAYRSGEKLLDSVYGKEQDYTKKNGIEYKNIYAPSHVNEHLLDRQTLWNEVEKSELKKNGELKTTARLAKEFEIAFPHEVDADTRKRMLDELAQTLVKNHNVVVDAVIHAPHTKSGSDERNYHAHIMFTTRSINELGELGKKTREFNDNGKNLTLAYRELWANMVNRELEQIGIQERVSHLSYSDLKYDLEPTVHEGSKVTQLRRQGIDTEISLKNDAIKARNAEKQRLPEILKGLEQEISLAESKISKYQSGVRLEASKQPPEATETKKQAEQAKSKENHLERKLELSSPKLKQLNDELNHFESEVIQLKRDVSTALKDYDELQKNKPQEKLFGFIPNPKFLAWKEKYSELKHIFNGKKDDLKLRETLVKSRKDDIERETIRLRSQPNIGREKPKELNFEQVYKLLNDKQKISYEVLKVIFDEKFNKQIPKAVLDKLQSGFVEKYKENPNFEMPMLEIKKEQEIEIKIANSSKVKER